MTVSSSLQKYTQYVDNQIVMTKILSLILQQQKGRATFFTALPLKKNKKWEETKPPRPEGWGNLFSQARLARRIFF